MKLGKYNDALVLLYNTPYFNQGKACIANSINILMQGYSILENYFNTNVNLFFVNSVMSYSELINEFINKGNYNNTVVYKPYNFVIYNDEIYMCYKEAPAGTLPTVEEYWVYIGLKGEKGVEGVDVQLKYNWNPAITYQPNDLVVSNNNIYVALKENTNINPIYDNDSWALFLMGDTGFISVGTTPPSMPSNNKLWIQTGMDPELVTPIDLCWGQLKRYNSSSDDWDYMYPNTVWTLVANPQQWIPLYYTELKNLQPSDWEYKKGLNQYVYVLDPQQGTVNNVIDIRLNAINPSEILQTEYDNIILETDNQNYPTGIILVSNDLPTQAIPLQILYYIYERE